MEVGGRAPACRSLYDPTGVGAEGGVAAGRAVAGRGEAGRQLGAQMHRMALFQRDPLCGDERPRAPRNFDSTVVGSISIGMRHVKTIPSHTPQWVSNTTLQGVKLGSGCDAV